MKRRFQRASPTMVVACLALFVSLTGTSIAASHYLITSTKQIKPSVLKQLKGAKGPRGQSVTGLTGPQGAKGDTGATGAQGAAAAGATGAQGAKGDTGATGAQGSSGVVTTEIFSGSATLPGGANAWVFAHYKLATVTTTASQRLTGAGNAATGSNTSATGQDFYYDLCYQPSTGGKISTFVESSHSLSTAFPEFRTVAATESVVPGAGTWNVGFCVANFNANSMDAVDVNGWVQVTN